MRAVPLVPLATLVAACAVAASLAGDALPAKPPPPDWTQTSLKGAAAPYGRFAGITALVRSKNRLYASTGASGVLFRSDDGGVAWKPVPVTGLGQKIFDLAADPGNPDRVWAAAWNYGVWATADGGKTWTNSVPCAERRSDGSCGLADLPSAIAVDPLKPQNVVVGARLRGIYVSSDGGASWSYPASKGVTTEVVNSGFAQFDPTVVFVHPRKPGIVLVGVNGTGIFRSTDGGRTFAKAMRGIAVKPVGETGASALKTVGGFVYDPVTKAVLVGMKTAVYRSVNDGASWTPSGKGIPVAGVGGFSGAIAQSPLNPKLLAYFGSAAPHLWGSADGGRTWKALSTAGLCCDSGGGVGAADALVFDGRKALTLYAGTIENGVYRSTNAGGLLRR